MRTIKNLNFPSQTVHADALRKSCPHMQMVPIAEYVDAKPKILLGPDNHHLGVPIEIRTDPEQRIQNTTRMGDLRVGRTRPTHSDEYFTYSHRRRL